MGGFKYFRGDTCGDFYPSRLSETIPRKEGVNMEKNREELIQGLERLGITAGEEEVSKLISFSELLLKWNKVYNLTAIRDEGRN